MQEPRGLPVRAEAPTGLPDLLDLPGLPGPTRQAPEAVLAPEGFGQTATAGRGADVGGGVGHVGGRHTMVPRRGAERRCVSLPLWRWHRSGNR